MVILSAESVRVLTACQGMTEVFDEVFSESNLWDVYKAAINSSSPCREVSIEAVRNSIMAIIQARLVERGG